MGGQALSQPSDPDQGPNSFVVRTRENIYYVGAGREQAERWLRDFSYRHARRFFISEVTPAVVRLLVRLQQEHALHPSTCDWDDLLLERLREDGSI